MGLLRVLRSTLEAQIKNVTYSNFIKAKRQKKKRAPCPADPALPALLALLRSARFYVLQHVAKTDAHDRFGLPRHKVFGCRTRLVLNRNGRRLRLRRLFLYCGWLLRWSVGELRRRIVVVFKARAQWRLVEACEKLTANPKQRGDKEQSRVDNV